MLTRRENNYIGLETIFFASVESSQILRSHCWVCVVFLGTSIFRTSTTRTKADRPVKFAEEVRKRFMFIKGVLAQRSCITLQLQYFSAVVNTQLALLFVL